jgi:hypothetical protein
MRRIDFGSVETGLVDEMVDRVEADQADDDEIEGDDEVQQSWNEQDQNAGDQRDERRDVSDGEDHFRTPGMAESDDEAVKFRPPFCEN